MVAAVFPSIAAAKWWMNGCHSSDSVDLNNKYLTPNWASFSKGELKEKHCGKYGAYLWQLLWLLGSLLLLQVLRILFPLSIGVLEPPLVPRLTGDGGRRGGGDNGTIAA